MEYMVFWQNNVRYGSVELNDRNKELAHKAMVLQLIQKDITGTEHYEVLAMKKIKPVKKGK